MAILMMIALPSFGYGMPVRDGISSAAVDDAFGAPMDHLAAGSHGGGHGMPDMKTGEPGEPAKVSRTIEIITHDNFYEPESLDIKEGETIRFVVRNASEFVHEFNIATAAMHEAHRPEMMMMVEHGVLEPDRINHEAAKAMQASMGAWHA